MYKKISLSHFYYGFAQREIVLIIVLLVSLYSYNLFHSLAETISIAISFGVYMVTWNSRRLIANQYFVFLGIAFFYIAGFDLLHAFAFQSGGNFAGRYDPYLSDHFWTAARYLQSFSFLAAAFFIGKGLKTLRAFSFYTAVSVIMLITIVWWPGWPATTVDGHQTAFNITNGIIICFLELSAILALSRHAGSFNKRVFIFLMWALGLSLISEIILAISGPGHHYVSIAVHMFKIASFNSIYMAFIEIGLRKPYALLFKELKDSEMNSRRSEKKFRTIFDNATVGIIMTDLDGRILETNQRLIELSGYRREELSNLMLSAPNVLSHNVFDTKEMRELRSGHIDHRVFENRYLKKDGRIMWGDTSISLIKDDQDNPQFMLWVIQDITQAKEIEQAKTDFISLVSHQLRTHLTSTRLATELLLRRIAGEIDDKQKRYLGEIHDSTKLMSDLIKNLLNVSRVELGTLVVNPEPIDLEHSIRQTIEDFSRQIKAKELRVDSGSDDQLPLIFFDPQILSIILDNLLANAISYTPIGGQINIRTRTADGLVLLAISDTGCGIPEADKGMIFTKLFRAGNAKEINPGGNGLGLYIVKAVADKAGIDIWFESQEGAGTTFFVSFPPAKTPPPAKQGQLRFDMKKPPY